MAFFWSGSIAVTDAHAVLLWGDLSRYSAESLCPSGGSPVAGLGWGWGAGERVVVAGRRQAGLRSDPEEEEMVSLFNLQEHVIHGLHGTPRHLDSYP